MGLDLLRASTISTGQVAAPHFRSSDSSQSGQGQRPVTEGALPAAEESRPRRSMRIRFPPQRLELSCTNMEQEELSEEEYEAAVNGTDSDLSISVMADASPDVTYRDDGSADYSSDDGETTANGYSYETVMDGQTPSLAEIVGHIRLARHSRTHARASYHSTRSRRGKSSGR